MEQRQQVARGATRVFVVGGGLAGISAALRLAERGCRVTLLEGSERLGGKAGSLRSTHEGRDHYDDHGYHIFPGWYLNLWRLVHELGLRDRFEDRPDFLQLKAGRFPSVHAFHDLTSLHPRDVWRNLTCGLLPPGEMLLFVYSALDLATQDYEYSGLLDMTTINGFVRSRLYGTEDVARTYQSFMLIGTACPSYEVSAMTMRNVLRFWARHPKPMYRVLRGNLHEHLIAPLQRRLEERGCEVLLDSPLAGIVAREGRVTTLRVRGAAGGEGTREISIDEGAQVVLAIPAERAALLVDDDLHAQAPALSALRYLHTRPMAALHLYFRERIGGIPREHVNLVDSPYGLTFIDVSQSWEGYDATALNLVASDITRLASLSPERAVEVLFRDLQRYLPHLRWEDVDERRTSYQPHVDEPLCVNGAGSWQHRPDVDATGADSVRGQLRNLFVAGDYCRSHVDLVCMEGAVTTGLRAAEALRREAGITEPVPIEEVSVPGAWLLALKCLKYLLLPVVLLVYQVRRSVGWSLTTPRARCSPERES